MKNAIAKASVRHSGIIGFGVHHGEALKDLRGKLMKRNLPRPTIGPEQGFVDIHGIFHTREAARKLAIAAGQVKEERKFPNIALDSSEFTEIDGKGKTVRKYAPFISR